MSKDDCRTSVPDENLHSRLMKFRALNSHRFLGTAICAIALLAASVLASAQAITVVKEGGRTIYVNNDASPSRSNPRALTNADFIYWSNTERRWKPVPVPSARVLRAARSAAAEVSKYVATVPAVVPPVGSANTPAPELNPNYMALTRGRMVSTEEIDHAIQAAAARHGVDPNLVRAVIKVESNFNPKALSRKGAMGLMQLMPSTARGLKLTNPFDPTQNVEAGVRHLKSLLQNFRGDVPLTLAAYNAGQGAVERNNGIPPYTETRNYVKRITNLYGTNGQTFPMSSGPRAAPVKMFRDHRGVITISNTE